MNFSRQVSRNISLQRAGLGFITDSDALRCGSNASYQDGHGVTEAGGLEIPGSTN